MTLSIRWIFALVAIACGLFVLVKGAGNSVDIAIGIGIISAGTGLVTA